MAEFQCIRDLAAFFASEYEKFPAGTVIPAERCPAGMTGDITVNCFRFAKLCGNPAQAAGKAAEFLAKHPDTAGAEAVKVWAWLALHTVRYRFEIFTWNYGCEIEELIGTIRPLEYIETEAKRMVEECLLVNPYILAVEDFDVILLQDIMVCGFTIVTEFGEVELNVAF